MYLAHHELESIMIIMIVISWHTCCSLFTSSVVNWPLFLVTVWRSSNCEVDGYVGPALCQSIHLRMFPIFYLYVM